MEEENEVAKTSMYSLDAVEEALVSSTLREVSLALREKGYNEINQLVGYLMSGDPGYISSHNDARNKIIKVDRSTILEILLKNYISKL